MQACRCSSPPPAYLTRTCTCHTATIRCPLHSHSTPSVLGPHSVFSVKAKALPIPAVMDSCPSMLSHLRKGCGSQSVCWHVQSRMNSLHTEERKAAHVLRQPGYSCATAVRSKDWRKRRRVCTRRALHVPCHPADQRSILPPSPAGPKVWTCEPMQTEHSKLRLLTRLPGAT